MAAIQKWETGQAIGLDDIDHKPGLLNLVLALDSKILSLRPAHYP